MKTKFTLLLLLTFSLVSAQIPSFATKKSLGNDMASRSNAAMVAVNNNLYILGGGGNSMPRDFTMYNPATGVLNKLKSLDDRFDNGCLFVVENKLYAIVDSTIKEYNIDTNTWSLISVTGIPSNFSADSGFVLNNNIYVCSRTLNVFIEYNPIANTVFQKADFPGVANRIDAFGFAINGKGYLGSGGIQFMPTVTNDFYEYDPLNDIWTIKSNLPTAFKNGVGISVDGKGYVGTGFGNAAGVPYKSYYWYEYDPITNLWISQQNFMNVSGPLVLENNGRAEASIASIGNDIYLFGGQTFNQNVYDDSIHKFATLTNTWSDVDTDLGKNRTDASGFFLNGKVYVGGGTDSEFLNDFWEYDTTTNNWSQKADMLTIYYKRASAEVSGKGYVIGGYNGAILSSPTNVNAYISSALEEYNPDTNSWTNKAPYPAGKRQGMIAMSYNGKLYAGLGSNLDGVQTNGFAEYNPATDTWANKMSAPFSGSFFNSFVIGNIGYVMRISTQNLIGKYNFDTNTWTTETHNIPFNNYLHYKNQAFVYNGIAYIVYSDFSANPAAIYKYNPAASTWSQVNNLPFTNGSQTIIPATSGVYFGFGAPGSLLNNPDKLGTVNDWRLLKFDAAVSNKFGVYKSEESVNFFGNPNSCGTSPLNPNATHSVYDINGDLFSSLTATSLTLGSCYTITSLDLAIPFKTATRNFGNGIVETGMFLNKNITTSDDSGTGTNGTIRFYYTTAELNKLVADFNTIYGTTKTIADIKIVKYSHPSNFPDADPMNNTLANAHSIYNSPIINYGLDKYYEIVSTLNLPANGEFYAVLLAGELLSNQVFFNNKITFYPNPATSVLNIKISDNSEIDRLTISDLSGKKIMEQKSSQTSVNVESLAKGMYVLEVVSGDNKMVNKFIKN